MSWPFAPDGGIAVASSRCGRETSSRVDRGVTVAGPGAAELVPELGPELAGLADGLAAPMGVASGAVVTCGVVSQRPASKVMVDATATVHTRIAALIARLVAEGRADKGALAGAGLCSDVAPPLSWDG